MVAGLPKAPSRYNPIVNPQRALIRRDYVLKRMLGLGYITAGQYGQAKAETVSASIHKAAIDIQAPYIGEMVRSHMYERFGEEAYTHGYKAYVTINPRLQQAAQNALRTALMDYERRHGYRGPIKHVELQLANEETNQQAQPELIMETEDESETAPEESGNRLELALNNLSNISELGNLRAALVHQIEEQSALALLKDGQQIYLPWDGLAWAAPYIDTNTKGAKPHTAADILRVGDIIYVQETSSGQWALGQIPKVAGAIVALDPKDGALIALAGGFDFFHTKFNRSIQAKRQPGSSFKPFVYSAALEKGFTLASIINDAPVVFDDPGLEASWRPENYSGRIYGPTRLREALVRSRNLVSIRLLQNIGVRYTINYAKQFGFDPMRLPKDLSLSLGSAAVTPLELANAYAVFANGGFSVSPYFIKRIEDAKGEIIFAADPAIACLECEKQLAQQALEQTIEPRSPEPPAIEELPSEILVTDAIEEESPPAPKLAKRIIPEQNVYLTTSMMRDVIRRGTGRRALQLGRKDLSGKTGTTNDQRDAWFAGFNSDIVTISWTGFDNAQPLGNRETGAKAALPMWINFMRQALKDTPETPLSQPPGLVTMRIDPETGLQASGKGKAIFETFRIENAPEKRAPDIDESIATPDSDNNEGPAPQLLF
jgi:penicillin-binding protein 1A